MKYKKVHDAHDAAVDCKRFKNSLAQIQSVYERSEEESNKLKETDLNLKGLNATLTDLAKAAVDNVNSFTLDMLLLMGLNPVSAKIGPESVLEYVKKVWGEDEV